MLTISKQWSFGASHVLDGLPEGHKCGRLHGHNYTVELAVNGHMDDVGFVIDYGDMKPFGDWIAEHLDHRHLNDITEENPTAEHLAMMLWVVAGERLQLAFRSNVHQWSVTVRETDKTSARYMGVYTEGEVPLEVVR